MSAYSPISISNRLNSLDALRGFDMFWIMGGEHIVHALHQVNQNSVLKTLSEQWYILTGMDSLFMI